MGKKKMAGKGKAAAQQQLGRPQEGRRSSSMAARALGAGVLLGAVALGHAGLMADVLAMAQDTLTSLTGLEFDAPAAKATAKHAEGVVVNDFSQTGLPKVRMGGRVMDLVHGLHFDDILMDTPDDIRPPGAVVFYDSQDSTCMAKYKALDWDRVAENEMPARERLFAARYDMYSAPRRSWYKFIPEMDLKKRFGVTECPQVVFVPRKCNGFTEWCTREVIDEVSYMGCEDFKEQCTDWKMWDGKGSMSSWLLENIENETAPKISPFLKTYAGQGLWMQKRDHTSSDNHIRNMYLTQAFPAFTHNGFKVMPIPKAFNDWLLEFYERNVKTRRTEYWDSESTQMSFVEVPTSFVDLDRERVMKEKYANEYLKPIVEEWSGVSPLELTSFYGMREYPDGSFLKNHVDRIDTHVLSVTMTVKKLDAEKAKANPWPLEVAQWSGDHVRYDHPEGTMILYESSKLPHGRPYRNRGGTHVGAFCHFKPVNMHGTDAAKWDAVTAKARANMRAHVTHKAYRSTKSVEPKSPVYSAVSYGDKSKWRHGDGATDEANDGRFPATFKNKSERPLDVYWVSDDGDKVHQGSLAPGSQFEVNTFRGHKFVWCAKGSKDPLPQGQMTMEKGRSLYTYSL